MTHRLNRHLVKAVADLAIFIEFSGEEVLDADAGVEALEQLAAELQQMDDSERADLAAELRRLSNTYREQDRASFVMNLPANLGLE